jgi:hypothetical protein
MRVQGRASCRCRAQAAPPDSVAAVVADLPRTRSVNAPADSRATPTVAVRAALAAAAALSCVALPAQQQEPAVASVAVAGTLRAVRITTGDVFAGDDPRVLTRAVNALHWQTREDTIAREVWLRPGDRVDAGHADELERNLRALGLFADVSVRLVPGERPGEVDLEITTRDRLTLLVGAGGSYVGGVTGVRAAIGEGNLFGLGDRLAASFARNSEDEYRGSVAYTDLHVLDSWHTATVRLSRTDEGDSGAIEVRRPFKHLADPRAHAFAASSEEAEADYYRAGETVAEVPYHRNALGGELTWGSGPRDARRYLGLQLATDHRDYEPARGPLAPEIRVPGDTSSAYLGPRLAWQWVDGYREVEGLDTLDYVQDLVLGTTLDLTAGLRWRDEDGAGTDVQPQLGAAIGWAAEPLTGLFTNVSARGTLRVDDGHAVGWNAEVAARAFAMVAERHTLAASAVLDAVEEEQDLPVELTLGEDVGLRGYRARLFNGTRRLRTNLEERWDTGLEVATLRLGLVAFADAGWIGRDEQLGSPIPSAGFGLRIGSKPLLGGGVLRIDFAKPLEDVPGENDDWKFSLTVGQVFTFGGNASGIGVR